MEILALDGQLLTRDLHLPVSGPLPADDVLLIAVVNRYAPTAPAVALIRALLRWPPTTAPVPSAALMCR